MLKSALNLAAEGFHVFPLMPNSKLPAIEGFPKLASKDPEVIRKWWIDPVMETVQPYNVGISTSAFGKNEALLVVDVDNKRGKNGNAEIRRLSKDGFTLPPTFTQKTPTGGFHLFYRIKEPVKQGTSVIAPGIDIRSSGGYVVGAGSSIDGTFYEIIKGSEIAIAPEWVTKKCGKPKEKSLEETPSLPRILNRTGVPDAAVFYLENEAPIAIEGENGDQVTFLVACHLKDMGFSDAEALTLMHFYWNPECQPPWPYADLVSKVKNAFKYGKKPLGILAPEVQFEALPKDEKTPSPIDKLNQEYAFTIIGGSYSIIHETKDYLGSFKLEFLSSEAFQMKLASQKIDAGGDKKIPLAKLWLSSPKRRSYDGICFSPGREPPKNFYNLWRGFSVERAKPDQKFSDEARKGLELFKEHALKNICRGDEKLYQWLMGYFAHLIQRPWEKPLTAVVFKGLKGVGKNVFVETIGKLISNHTTVTSDRRYLLGNFNSFLENNLLMVLDEAFWSGDKQSEGILKHLVTGEFHNIEHKGKEPYKARNLTRVAVIGNDDWIVPASHDERRFAVFNVGAGRMQDLKFFTSMRKGMEAGGYSILLDFLLSFDLSGVEINFAPQTEGLHEQKIESLGVFYQFWYECLQEGGIIFSNFNESWPETLPKEELRDAFKRYTKDRQIASRIPSAVSIGKFLFKCCPAVKVIRDTKEDSTGKRSRNYYIPNLETCRKAWETFIKHEENW